MFISWILSQANCGGEGIGENVGELDPPGVYWHRFV